MIQFYWDNPHPFLWTFSHPSGSCEAMRLAKEAVVCCASEPLVPLLPRPKSSADVLGPLDLWDLGVSN